VLAAVEVTAAQNLRGRSHDGGGSPRALPPKNNVKDWVGGGGRRYQPVLFIITIVAVGIYFRGRRHSRSLRRSSVAANVGQQLAVTTTVCRVVGRR